MRTLFCRLCLAAVVFATALSGVLAKESSSQTASGDANLAQLRALRRELAQRKRGVIYSNDGCDATFEATEPTVENLLKQRAIPHLGGHVGSVFYSTTFSLGLYWHDSKVPGVDIFTTPHVKTGRNMVGKFIQQGTDPLEIMVDFYQKNQTEIFSTIRMNDIHDAGYYRYGNIPKWKLDHPEWLFGTIKKDPAAAAKLLANPRFKRFLPYLDPVLKDYMPDKVPTGTYAWSGADFSVPEVRQMSFQVINDICHRYEVDGINLDFLRHTPYFKSVAWNKPVTTEETDLMTELVRRIRKMTEEEGLRRGRPILVSVRILDGVAMNEAQGLDVKRWLDEDLIDIMVVGWGLAAPLRDMVKLGKSHGVPVYMHMHRAARGGPEGQRGWASMAWADGADGVYMFNYFDPRWLPLFNELGDPMVLQKLDKIFCTNPKNFGGLARFSANCVGLISVPKLSPNQPQTVKPGGKYSIGYFPVGDDVLWGKDEGIRPDLRLRIQVSNLAKAEDIGVMMNDQRLNGGKLSGDWLDFPIEPKLVKKGNNTFEITLQQRSKSPVVLRDLQLHVKY